MKQFFLSIVILLSVHSRAQFDSIVARDMIAICNSYTFSELYKSDTAIIPKAYQKKYTSEVFGMDNVFQIYTNGNTAVFNIRGSTAKKSSWLENIYSAMIPATGNMKVSGENFDYCFAKDKGACVHSGYALGIAFLRKEVIAQINKLNKEGIYDIIITGHSQGGALSNMLRAYLENLSAKEISKKNTYRVYAFAAPMVGNVKFADEYNQRYELNKSSYNIVNVSDAIPTFPLTYNDTNYFKSNINNLLFDRKSFSMKKIIKDGMVNMMEPGVRYGVNKTGTATQ
ncbi:MAG: hypothetical protein IAF38_15210, partial [Bacteroidia bacterium]|nr:hypothetical protein [Bacteroidia bacterium]